MNISRRELLAAMTAMPLINTISPARSKKLNVAVIGAGAFGGWTALHLLRRGAQVTLIDAWGPGNSRASSGGETRVIRGTYGPGGIYTRMVARSLALWKENEARWNRKLYHKTGALWMVSGQDDQYEKESRRSLKDAGLEFEELSSREAAKRYPQINFDGVKWAIYEKDAGYLTARRACEVVLDTFVKEGGSFRLASARPGPLKGGEMQSVELSDGSTLAADQYVFACGPWLGKLFPDVIGNLIAATRQEVFFFGVPAGETRFQEDRMPVWIDHGEKFIYGIPGNEWRGFKVADDTRGDPFDPTDGERTPSAEGIKAARKYLAFRFPALKDAPLVESRVCQYENSPDHNFIIDRHPGAKNVLLVGGGSGHGFKHGPAVGERAADVVQGKPPDPFFTLSRFHK
ncbi:MAG TPA: FAD-dependent oxidoreductase [Blastocatellia bacterium]|nr:FAD-dependent oxidoreductase [Blastocatellia bacterium]